MSAAVLIAVGVVLCVAGALSLRLVVLAAGFGTGWILGDVFGASTGTALAVAVGAALAALVATVLLARLLLFFVGGVVGAVLGAKLFVLLGGSDPSWLLAVVFVPCVAFVAGFLAARYEHPFVRWGTAFAGAAIIMGGLARLGGPSDHLFRTPRSAWETLVLLVCWVGLGLLGRTSQRRLAHEDQPETSSAPS